MLRPGVHCSPGVTSTRNSIYLLLFAVNFGLPVLSSWMKQEWSSRCKEERNRSCSPWTEWKLGHKRAAPQSKLTDSSSIQSSLLQSLPTHTPSQAPYFSFSLICFIHVLYVEQLFLFFVRGISFMSPYSISLPHLLVLLVPCGMDGAHPPHTTHPSLFILSVWIVLRGRKTFNPLPLPPGLQ